MNQYLTIVRDAKNVIVHAIHHAATDMSKAVETGTSFISDKPRCGILENERVGKHPRPFRYIVGQTNN